MELLKLNSQILADKIEYVHPCCKTPFYRPDVYAVYAYI